MASDLNGNYFSFGRDNTTDGPAIFSFDPVTWLGTPLGPSEIDGLTALAFDGSDRLFGLSGDNSIPSILYEFDPLDGSLLSTIGDTGYSGLVGLDFHPGTGDLYAYDNGPNTFLGTTLAFDSSGTGYSISESSGVFTLVSFDPSTGLITALGLPPSDITALAFDNTDRLFAATGSDGKPSRLLEIDPANGQLISDIGAIGFNGVTGLAFEPTSQVLIGHAQSPNQLITIDPVTGVGTFFGFTGLGGNLNDMGFGPGDGVLYGVITQGNKIVTFDLNTGTGTEQGNYPGAQNTAAIGSDGTALYYKSEDELYSINTSNFSTTLEETLRSPGQILKLDKSDGSVIASVATNAAHSLSDISFDPATNDLYGWDRQVYDLVTIDMMTGSVVIVGDSTSNRPAGLAFSRKAGNSDLIALDGPDVYEINTGTGLGTYIASGRSQVSTLLEIDTTTGAATAIGTPFSTQMQSGFWSRFSDLAFDTDSGGSPNYGVLYGHHDFDGDIYTFDTATGAATRLGESGSTTGASGLVYAGTQLWLKPGFTDFRTVNQTTGASVFSFNAAHGTGNSDDLSTLSLINGQAIPVGQTGVDRIDDLAFDSNGNLFGWDDNDHDLLSINTTTGAASIVGDSGISEFWYGLTFDDTDGLFMKAGNQQYSVNALDGSVQLLSEYERLPPRLLTVNPATAATTLIGYSTTRSTDVPDMTFTQDGRLLGFETDDHESVVEFDLGTGAVSTLLRSGADRVGLAVTSDGTLWLKDTYYALYHANPVNGLLTFIGNTEDQGQDGNLAVNSSDQLYTHNNSSPGPLYTLDPLTGALTFVGNTNLNISALAFDDSDRLFAITGNFGNPSTLYELDPADGSTLATIGYTGLDGIEAMDFDPVSGNLYAHNSTDGMLMTIDPVTAAVTPVGQTGALEIEDLAFAPDGTLYGWFREDDDFPYDRRQTLVRIDPADGTTQPLNRFGDFDSKLTLLDTDGTTELASSEGAPFVWGEWGSNPDDPGVTASEDAYIEYDFTVPGTYYLRVGSRQFGYIPFGGAYSLNVSIPGELEELIHKDGFEDPDP